MPNREKKVTNREKVAYVMLMEKGWNMDPTLPAGGQKAIQDRIEALWGQKMDVRNISAFKNQMKYDLSKIPTKKRLREIGDMCLAGVPSGIEGWKPWPPDDKQPPQPPPTQESKLARLARLNQEATKNGLPKEMEVHIAALDPMLTRMFGEMSFPPNSLRAWIGSKASEHLKTVLGLTVS